MVPLPIAKVQLKFNGQQRKQSLLVFKDIFTKQPSRALLKTINNSNHCDRSENQPRIYTGYACSVRIKFVQLNHCSIHLLLHLCALGVVHDREAAWPSGQLVRLAIRRSRVRVPPWPLAGFVLGRPEFKFSATLVNSQLVAFCQLGFLILLCSISIICF